MRKTALAIAISAVIISGCGHYYSPAPREIVSGNMGAILVVERKFVALLDRINSVAVMGGISKETGEKMRGHLHVYTVYHQAAMNSLAHGELGDYAAFVAKAMAELEAVELLFAKPA